MALQCKAWGGIAWGGITWGWHVELHEWHSIVSHCIADEPSGMKCLCTLLHAYGDTWHEHGLLGLAEHACLHPFPDFRIIFGLFLFSGRVVQVLELLRAGEVGALRGPRKIL